MSTGILRAGADQPVPEQVSARGGEAAAAPAHGVSVEGKAGWRLASGASAGDGFSCGAGKQATPTDIQVDGERRRPAGCLWTVSYTTERQSYGQMGKIHTEETDETAQHNDKRATAAGNRQAERQSTVA